MKHPISYDEWLGYVDGETDESTASRIRGHLKLCGECQATWRVLLDATAALRAAGREYAAAYTVDGCAVRRSRDRVLARIREPECAVALEGISGGELTLSRLRRLQLVVSPVCGAKTAFRLIVAAVGRTPAPQCAEAWDIFLEQLTELTSAVCGRSTARLVWQIGSLLP